MQNLLQDFLRALTCVFQTVNHRRQPACLVLTAEPSGEKSSAFPSCSHLELVITHCSPLAELGCSSSAANARNPFFPAASIAAGILRGCPLGAVARATPEPDRAFTEGALNLRSAENLHCELLKRVLLPHVPPVSRAVWEMKAAH